MKPHSERGNAAHQIVFHACNDWSTALPLGNGKMGGMVFFKDRAVHIALNQYDCYYPVLPRYAQEPAAVPFRTYEALCEVVRKEREKPDFSRTHYVETLHPTPEGSRPAYTGNSYPMAGEVLIRLHPEFDLRAFSLRLIIEEGTVVFTASGQEGEVSLKAWVAKETDTLFCQMHQSRPGLWLDAELARPSGQGQGRYAVDRGNDGDTCWTRTSFAPEGEQKKGHVFTAETALGASHDCGVDRDYLLAATVLPGTGVAIAENRRALREHARHAVEHRTAWKAFWRSTVRLPDYFLETLWHLHMYCIGCASGLGSAFPEQACGLNGLWDIRRPSLWGSMWYWDVNIQEAFWPVFSSNHLELGRLFCDGYLRYERDAEQFAKEVYGADGWALDYPHALYYCIQPWCAQFLWQYYRYSGDLAFLRDVAYRVFQKQIAFFAQIAKRDQAGVLHIDPDISPEQGPVTRDSVITIASVKQLLRYALRAADILERPAREKDEFARLLAALPDYEKTQDGRRWKDSALAPDDLFLRHPSVLMPIFPAEEVGRDSPAEIREAARNTLQHAIGHTETGVFGFGWLSCAAARLREGTAALRILYEEGLDYILHANGLGYEESERFVNYCLVTKPPIYPPAMMEPSGGIVMAVNMMLLQAEDYIEVFPAIPDGKDGLLEKKAAYAHLEGHLRGHYPAWEDVGFDGLLAPGGFEVSAERKSGRTCRIQVVSTRQATLRLLLPAELSPSGVAMVYQKEMEPQETVCFGCPAEERRPAAASVQMRQAAYTHRRVFLGGDRHTAFYKAVDAFVCAYRLGNAHQYQMTPYVFDFGCVDGDKNYDAVFHKAFYVTNRSVLFFGGPRRHGIEAYQPDTGYGFACVDGLCVKNREQPDDLRRDFIEAETPHTFWMELPRGKYDLLIVSGDEEEASLTHLSLPAAGIRVAGSHMAAGAYQCKTIPFVQESDGLCRIDFSSEAGHKWKLNAIFVNKAYAYS